MGRNSTKNNQLDMHEACTQLLSAERFSADRAHYCSGEDTDDENHWHPTADALPLALSSFRTEFGRDAVVSTLTQVIEHEGDALFLPPQRTIPILTFVAAALASFGFFYWGLEFVHPATALALSLIPLVIISVCSLGSFQVHSALDRFDETLGSLRSALTTTATTHRTAMEKATADLSGGSVTATQLATIQLLQDTGHTAAETVESVGKQLSTTFLGSARHELSRSVELVIAAIALVALGFAGTIISSAGLWAIAQVGTIALGGGSLALLAAHNRQKLAQAKASLVEHTFGVDRHDAQSPTTSLRGHVDIASVLAAAPEEVTEGEGPSLLPVSKRAATSSARDIHRLRLAAAPMDNSEARMPRDVWEA